jgi:hypothetical protein
VCLSGSFGDIKTKGRPDRTVLHAIIDNRELLDKSQAMYSLVELNFFRSLLAGCGKSE